MPDLIGDHTENWSKEGWYEEYVTRNSCWIGLAHAISCREEVIRDVVEAEQTYISAHTVSCYQPKRKTKIFDVPPMEFLFLVFFQASIFIIYFARVFFEESEDEAAEPGEHSEDEPEEEGPSKACGVGHWRHRIIVEHTSQPWNTDIDAKC